MTKSASYTTALSLLLPILCTTAKHHPPAFAFLPHQTHPLNPFFTHSTSSPVTALSSTTQIVNEIPSDATLDSDPNNNSYDPEAILQARNRLLALSTTLASNSPSGRFITRTSDKIKLQQSVNDLEALTNGQSPTVRDKELLLGDWTLIATANVPSSDIRRRINERKQSMGKGGRKSRGRMGWWNTKNGENTKNRSGLSLFGNEGKELNPIQKSVRKSIEVTQRIRNDGAGADDSPGGSGEINRVDNVIEYTPLDTLKDILPEDSPFFEMLGNVNVNPLKVKKSKVVLVHKAEVESVVPVLRTTIAWVSSVLNIAGNSQPFDPEGSDIIATNVPLGEFLGKGTFDTPYVDNDMRISRTTGPVLEQLRVFVRKGSHILNDTIMDGLVSEMRVEEEREVGHASSNSESSETLEKVSDAAQTVRDTMTSLGENVLSAVEKDMEGVTNALGTAMDDVVERVQDIVEEDLKDIGKAVEEVGLALQEGGNGGDVGDAILNVTKAVGKVPSDVRSVVEEDLRDVGEAVEDSLDDMVKDVQDSVEEDLKKIGESIEGVQSALVGEDGEDEAEEESEDENKEDIMDVIDAEKDLLDAVASDVHDSVEEDLKKIGESIDEGDEDY